MIYKDFCEHFGLDASHQLGNLIPQPDLSTLQVSPAATAKEVLAQACGSVYPLMEDNARMHEGNDFDLLRKNYPVRREFSSLQLHGMTNTDATTLMSGLGFDISHETP